MYKRYKLVYHFKDGSSWGPESHDVALTADQIAILLKHQQKSENMEVMKESTGETKKVGEIKSIELLF
ncbi:hypothetical protein GFC29_3114 [Anoxybacillus sp. B7M1]|uniref:hypothetical protein n=1 Tax=unclassified Anoxybacillus TaxID=2639704 RepID=UPI0005CD3FD2|nr:MULTISPECIES: hypothetical protein [unclassified Anoxybacillus]ANB55713.1 hypothetical protein GFC28_2322 [Anoxybacillus sp. B2M1]ANB65399.1 hypothetical protein GFC29_3114 [Anoxybacillus sp. B7M1]